MNKSSTPLNSLCIFDIHEKNADENDSCIVQKFFDDEEKRTGKRPTSVYIYCRCKKCNRTSL